MDREHIIELSKLLNLKNMTPVGDWIHFSCPFAKISHPRKTDIHPSFGISINPNGASWYNCFTCHAKGNIKGLPATMELVLGEDFSEARYYVFSNSTTTEEDSVNIEFFNSEIEPMDKKILQTFAKLPDVLANKFKLSKEIVDKYNIKYDTTSKRIVFPIYNKKNELVGIRGRLISDNILRAKYYSYTNLHPKRQDPKTYGIWYLINEPLGKNDTLFLVEGERDALSLKQYDFELKVWASMGAKISIRQLHNLIKLTNEVVLFFDNDSAGKKAKSEVLSFLRNAKNIYEIKNYAGCKDPAEIVAQGAIKTVLDSITKLKRC